MRFSNWIGTALLLLAGWVLVRDLASWKDVAFGDETTYLASGLTFSVPFVGGAQWGPLYAAWYAFWHLFIANKLDLYYFNCGLLSVMAGALVFLYLRSGRLPFWASVWVAVLFLFSAQNLPLDPKISIAPLCLMLATLCFIQFFQLKPWLSAFLVAFVALVCAYCRPEFYVAFLVATVLAVWLSWRTRATIGRRQVGVVAGFVGGVVVLHLLFQNPLFSGDGSRSAVAFQQHFIYNYLDWKKQPMLPTIEDQIELYHQIFGNEVESMTDALRKKPDLVLKHLLTNAKNTLLVNLRNLNDIFYQTPLHGWRSNGRVWVLVLALAWFLWRIDYRETFQKLRHERPNGWYLCWLLVFIAPSLIATVLVYPRTHYVVFHTLLLFWGIVMFSKVLIFRPLAGASVVTAGLLGVFLAWRWVNLPQTSTPNADNIRFINKLNYQKEIVSLEREWYRVFLKKPSIWAHVEQYQYANGDFKGFVKKQGINFILMTRDMQQYFAKDAGFAAFEAALVQEGFKKLPTNAYGEYLLVKADLIF